MPKMSIQRSVQIDSQPSKVFSIVSDFNQWRPWSPWLIMDADAVVTVRSDAKYYDWKGDRVGEGNMNIINEVENATVDYDLMFLKPWKSKAKVSFYLKPEANGTMVTWTMDSSLPFFLFWMKKLTEAFIGMDYERGLSMLKEYTEKGVVNSELDFKGESSIEKIQYIGIDRTCSKEELGEAMKADLTRIAEFFEDKKDSIAGAPLSIYEKWDMVKDQIRYTTAIPISKSIENIPSGMKQGEIPATKVYTIEHKGAYDYLGNAWSTLNNMARSKEFKWNKKIFPFEVYLNDPADTKPEDLITAVHFPVK